MTVVAIPLFEFLRSVLPADVVLVGGAALVLGTVVGFFLTSLLAWIKTLLVGLAIRQAILVTLGSVGLSIEALIPGGTLGVVRGLIPFL